MDLRSPAILLVGVAGVAALFLPGRGLMVPALLLGRPNISLLIPMAIVIFCAVYFGTLQFWKLLTGDKLQKPLPALLALFLAIRLTVECARMMMWG